MENIVTDSNLLLVDAHCHLSVHPDEINPKTSIEHIFEKYVPNKKNLVLNVMTNSHKEHEILLHNNIFKNSKYSNTKLGVGIHPWYCHRYTLKSHISKLEHYQEVLTFPSDESGYLKNQIIKKIDKFPDLININSIYSDDVFSLYNFVGEVGLDFSANILELCDILDTRDVKVSSSHQINVLKFFIDKAVQHSYVLSLHSVNARLDTYSTLKEYDDKLTSKLKIIFHSYSGTIEQFEQQYMKLQHIETYMSLSGYINLKEPLTKKSRKLIEKIDCSRILLETDVPINTDEVFDFREIKRKL
ncbi:hypothetical protein QEN19_003725 [Hanseniaspora menglaensis]